jgi:hypothetical protein
VAGNAAAICNQWFSLNIIKGGLSGFQNPWTSFSYQDKTWAEFSTLKVTATASIPLNYIATKQNCLT